MVGLDLVWTYAIFLLLETTVTFLLVIWNIITKKYWAMPCHYVVNQSFITFIPSPCNIIIYGWVLTNTLIKRIWMIRQDFCALCPRIVNIRYLGEKGRQKEYPQDSATNTSNSQTRTLVRILNPSHILKFSFIFLKLRTWSNTCFAREASFSSPVTQLISSWQVGKHGAF